MTPLTSPPPHLTGQAEHLLAQHSELLGSIDALLKTLRTKGAEPPDWDEIQRQGHDFVARLIEHEREEHLLLQEAYEQDEPPLD